MLPFPYSLRQPLMGSCFGELFGHLTCYDSCPGMFPCGGLVIIQAARTHICLYEIEARKLPPSGAFH